MCENLADELQILIKTLVEVNKKQAEEQKAKIEKFFNSGPGIKIPLNFDSPNVSDLKNVISGVKSELENKNTTGLENWVKKIENQIKTVKMSAENFQRSSKNLWEIEFGNYSIQEKTDSFRKLSAELSNIGLNTGIESRISSLITSIESQFDKLRDIDGLKKLRQQLEEIDKTNISNSTVKQLEDLLKSSKDLNMASENLHKYEVAMSQVNSQLQTLNLPKSKLAEFTAEFEKIKSSDLGISAKTKQFGELSNSIKQSSIETVNLGNSVKHLLAQFISLNLVIQKFSEALSVMKKVDSELVTIQKVTDMTKESIDALAESSYKVGSDFGKSADKYLNAVAEAAKAGYMDKSSEFGKLSLLAQNAGDVNQETANKFLIAADAAWTYEGNVASLTSILDGFNEVSNKNAVSVQDLSEGIRVAGSMFAQTGLSAQDYTAIVGTAVASTQQTGNEMARAWRTILMNMRQIKGTDDEGGIIDEATLGKGAAALESIGVKITEVKNGITRLRDTKTIIEELAAAWQALSKEQRTVKQAELVEGLGGKVCRYVQKCA